MRGSLVLKNCIFEAIYSFEKSTFWSRVGQLHISQRRNDGFCCLRQHLQCRLVFCLQTKQNCGKSHEIQNATRLKRLLIASIRQSGSQEKYFEKCFLNIVNLNSPPTNFPSRLTFCSHRRVWRISEY